MQSNDAWLNRRFEAWGLSSGLVFGFLISAALATATLIEWREPPQQTAWCNTTTLLRSTSPGVRAPGQQPWHDQLEQPGVLPDREHTATQEEYAPGD